MNLHLLSLMTWLPLAGAVMMYFTGDSANPTTARNSRWIALWTSLLVLVLAVIDEKKRKMRAAPLPFTPSPPPSQGAA